MSGGLYSFAKLGGIECGLFRLRGVGLANCLFPWARCVLATKRFGLTRLASTWPQFCHQQWIRHDRDKRSYVGLMDEAGHAVTGVSRLATLATHRWIPETYFRDDPAACRRGIVVFSGIDGYFSSMLRQYSLVREFLLASTVKHHRPQIAGELPGVAIHVRYGDATDPESEQARTLKIPHHLRQRMSWFVHVLTECRRHLGSDTPAFVFSDASDQELRPLLTLPRVERLFFGSSIADLHAMSAAPLLIASGSTFSMWAAYLGRMPVIWPPGQRRQRLHGDLHEYEPEVGMEPLPGEFAALIRKRFSRDRLVQAEFA